MSELEGTVYDVDQRPAGFITRPVDVLIEPAWRGRSVATFTVAADHEYADAFQADGARVAFAFRGTPDEFTGYIVSNDGDYVAPGADITYTCIGDDAAALDDIVAVPVPERPFGANSLNDPAQGVLTGAATTPGTIDGQGGHYRWPAAAATSVETAVRELLRANLVTRLGLPYTFATDQGRGGRAILPEVRFAPLREPVEEVLGDTSLALRIRQNLNGAGGINVDFTEAGEWAQEITRESGIIVNLDGSITAPTVTRTIAGGPGEMAARVIRATTEGIDRTPLERRYGRVIETFRDATGMQLTWPDDLEERYRVPKYFHLRVPVQAAALASYLDGEARKDIAAGAPTAGLTLDLAETDDFRYGGPDGIQLGTRVHLNVRGVEYSERVTGARIHLSSSGLVATPLLGARSNDPDQLILTAIAQLQQALRRRAGLI